MYCRNCGCELNDNQAVCLKCGAKVGVGNTHCANCGKEVDKNAAFCLNCGAAIKKGISIMGGKTNKESGEPGDLGGHDKTTMALICIFLGGLGIHNFMMGEQKKGIAKIVLTALCGVGTVFVIMDFIKILTDKYVVDPNAFI